VGSKSGIEWTTSTWNPITGCSRVSPGCRRCYAETQAAGRLKNSPRYEGTTADGRWTGTILRHEDKLGQPMSWRDPRRIFVNSMSDPFHENLIGDPEGLDFLARMFAVMIVTPRHDFQLLTKRHEEMAATLTDPAFRARVRVAAWEIIHRPKRPRPPSDRVAAWLRDIEQPWPSWLWLGVSVENAANLGRVDALRTVPAEVRWISAEPLLGELRGLNLDGIAWVVAGGESGVDARPMHPEWLRHLRSLCADADVAYLVKQWGEWVPKDDAPPGSIADDTWATQVTAAGAHGDTAPPVGSRFATMYRVGKARAGRTLDGRAWDEYPRSSSPVGIGGA
jgi:protein gp37